MSGHSHPKIVEVVKKQIENGMNYGEDHVEAHEVDEELVKRFKLDMGKFSNTGAEATLHALRISWAARAALNKLYRLITSGF